MKITKKLLALLLTVLMLFSSISCITVLAEEAAEATETTTTITESATQFLYDQAYNGAIKDGDTAPTKSNNKIVISQTGPWRVAGKSPDGASYKDVGYYWYRSDLDMRYGYSTWSYTTPFIGPAYKYGDTSKKVLRASLRPRSNDSGDRYNAFMELYYIAEASGEYKISDGIGGFTVRESAANNYEVYVTVLANGIEIFKSQALSRIHRIARFEDQKVTLNKGDKLEYRFEYITTADTFSGDIIIDFDPYVTLLEEKVETLPTLEGASPTDLLYDELYNMAPTYDTENSTETYNTPITQSKAWRAEYYEGSQWNEMVYYTNGGASADDATKPDPNSHWLNWTYNSNQYSNTQSPYIGVGYWNYNMANGKALRAMLIPTHSAVPVRVSYKAEYEGDYTLSMAKDMLLAINDEYAPGLTDCTAYAHVTVNGKAIWTSSAITTAGDSAAFEALSFKLNKGDVLAIEFSFTLNEGAEAGSGNIKIDFIPQLAVSKVYPAVSGDGSVTDFFYDELYNLPPTGGTTYNTPITQTKPWRAESYSGGWQEMGYYCNGGADDKDATKPETYTHYLNWTYHHSSSSNTQHSLIAVRYWKQNVANPVTLTGKLSPHYNGRPVRISYETELDGEYLLSMLGGMMRVRESNISGCKAYAYVTVNGNAVWTSPALTTKGQEVTFDDLKLKLLEGDVLGIEFKYVLDEGVTKGSGAIQIDFRPDFKLIRELPQLEGDGEVANVFYNALEPLASTGKTSKAATQTAVWKAQHYSSSKWTNYAKYCNISKSYGGDLNWGFDRGSYTQFDRMSIRYKGGAVANGLYIKCEIPMNFSNSNYSYTHRQSRIAYTAERDGIYSLTDKFGEFIVSYGALTRFDFWVQVTHNDAVLWKSDILANSGETAKFDGVTVDMKAGDVLAIEFRYSKKAGVTEKIDTTKINVDFAPILTYSEAVKVEDKDGYTPEVANRYYAEGLTVPSSVSAYINTTSAIPGYIVKSDAFALSVAPNGNPTVTYKNGEETKQIVFPINVKGGWKKLGVSYDAVAKKWNCLVNDINMASVEDTEFVAGGAIDKLYIGASDDSYNNQHFRGEIAELKFGDTAWALSDITKETGLTLETLNVESDCSDTFLTFKNQNYRYELYEEFAVPVNTFEAWVRLKTEYADDRSAGRLISSGLNYDPYTTISVIAGGKVQLKVVGGTSAGTVTFNTDIRSDEFVHLAITADTVNGIYNCYINGILVDSQQSSVVIPVSPRAYLVSGDYYYNNKSVHFEGDVAGVAMFSDVRTPEEILADMYGGTDLTDAALLGKWSFADTEEGLINQNGNGNDFHPFWETEPDEDVDESFGNYSTFVLIPDTQNFTQNQGAEGLAKISNWILNNKDTENIVGVIGLGDIVNIDKELGQWQAAQQGLLGYPDDKGVTVTEGLPGNVPFLFIQGNHDIGKATTDAEGNTVYRNTTNLNTYFPFEDLKDNFDGYFEEGKVDNIYILTEDDKGNKYMLLGLEFHPRNEVLDWANEVVAAHPDYNVIVSTHGYQSYNYTTDEQVYISSTSDDYLNILGENNNPGNQIWEKFVKNHKNIIMVACGHVYHEDIFVTTKQGVNGNTVIEMIANGQTTDVQMRMSGSVVILRVSEDGTKANVQYYSPVSGQYLKDLNQFNMDWHLIEDEVANIGGESFSDLQDAVDAAEDNDVIEIVADIEVSGSLTIDKAVTIKLGADKVLKANGGSIKVNAYTVITGDGSFTSLDGENPFDIAEGAKLYVEGGSFTGWNPATKGNDFVTDGFGVKAENGTFTVAASDIVADMDNDGNHSITDVAALRAHMMGVTGTDYRDVNGDGLYDARDMVRSKRVLAGLYNTIATSEELVAAMENGGNHILVKDLTVSDTSVIVPAGVEATLDLNGNSINGTFNVPEKETYTSADNRILFDVKGALTINGEGAIDLTVTGGDMGWSAMSVAVLANGGDVTINDATVHNESVTAMAYALDTNPWGPNGDTVEVVLNNVDIASSYLTVRVRDGGPSLVRLTATDSHFGYLYEGYNYLGYIWYQENDNDYGTAVEVVLDNCEVDTRYISTEYLSVLRYADNAEEAQAAIDNAVAGDTIVLKEGVNYGTLVFGQNADSRVVDISDLGGDAAGNEHYSKYENITILGNGAIVDQIDFKVGWIDGTEGASYVDIKNLTVKGVNFSGEKTAFNMESGKGGFLGIDGLTITDCSMNDADGDDRFVFQQITGYKELNDKTANEYVMTTGVKNLTITECEVTGAYMVIESRAMENLTITNNTFTGIKARDMLITSDVTNHPDIAYIGTITITGNTSSYGEERFVRASVNGDVEMIITDNTINSYLGADGDYIKISGATGTVTVEDNSITYGSAVSAQAALDVATNGSVITLVPGVDYGTLYLRQSDLSVSVDTSDWAGDGDVERYRKIEGVTIIGNGAIVDAIVTESLLYAPDGNQHSNSADMPHLASYIEIKDLVIDGINFTGSAANAISFTNHVSVDGVTISNCTMTDDGNSRLFFTDIGSNNTYTDKTTGEIIMVTGLKNISIIGCEVTGAHMVAEFRGTENITITGNTSSGIKARDYLLSGSGYSGEIVISGNTSSYGEERFVRMSGADNATVVIENNIINNYLGADPDPIKVTITGDVNITDDVATNNTITTAN